MDERQDSVLSTSLFWGGLFIAFSGLGVFGYTHRWEGIAVMLIGFAVFLAWAVYMISDDR